jgi:putative oxidoreductase
MTAGISLALLLLRIGVGVTMAGHGAQKAFGWFGGPGVAGFTGAMRSMGIKPAREFALLAATGELLGGILVLLGLLNPLGPLMIAGGLVVAIVTAHLAKGFWNTKGGYEFPLLIIVASLALSISGPGPISLDSVLGINLPEPVSWIVLAIVSFGASAAALGSRRMATRLELG